MTDYFINRSFCIKLGDFISSKYELRRGTPQGSVLSPILFALYYNDVLSVLTEVKFVLFADDLVFYTGGSNTSEIIQKLEVKLFDLNNWFKVRKLTINAEKTKFMLFHKTSERNLNLNLSSSVQFENTTIERVNKFKYLGIWLDCSLAFDEHWEHAIEFALPSVV